MSRDAGCLTEENMGYENSTRIEPKRGHQWFMDTCEPELFNNNKKQALEAVNGSPVSDASHLNVSPWDTTSGFQSVPGQFTDRLFGSESVPTVNLVDRNIPSVGIGNLSMGRKDFENQHGNDPSVGLSMSHTIEDPSSCLNFSGIRKVKVNQVRDSDCSMSASVGHSYNRADNCTISAGADYNKNDDNSISLGPTYDNDDSPISLGPTYNNGNENTISMGTAFSKADDNLVSVGLTYSKGDRTFMLMGHNYGKGEDNILSMGQPFDKGDGNFISMGGIISGYNLLLGNQSTTQTSEGQKDPNDSSSDPIANGTSTANGRTEATVKNKEPKMAKKVPSNNFPSNVKSLLSTGMFDGVPVKYVSWSREKNLKGVIKGTGYLCSCNDCKHVKALNAYEFERHAGSKTKHPNNHIYFENGKTIYAVVQELKNTPQDMLFDAIQNVTGSPINQKNFRVWKASYQAATRELQRIYGKDEVTF
ncbi:putative DNA-binding protein [Quillaja saponaria]|uniref:DNA-binding protein n=1 Tax=Quillaja saponaria TaxID=32244 RepID=A0AAD7PY36_QUISA|nr:putative DNA-binding protein [Quillaja saponaria]KAJ7971311.1 putative DNA-binding protein [Quillaja saponaria]